MREQEIFPPRHFPPSGDSALQPIFESEAKGAKFRE